MAKPTQPNQVDSWLDDKQPNRQTVVIPLRPDLIDEAEQLKRQIEQTMVDEVANNLPHDKSMQLSAELDMLNKLIADSNATFTFQGLVADNYRQLLADHPPRTIVDEETGQTRIHPDDQGPGYDTVEFPARLIAASSYKPKITVKQARRIFAEWGEAESTTLYNAAVAVNRRIRTWSFGSRR